MKNLALTLIGLSLSCSAFAQTYKAPKFEYDDAKKQEVKVVSPSQESWRSNYKVQQTPEVQRNVASDQDVWLDDAEKAQQKKDYSRDPSSVTPSSDHPHVKPWIWTGK